MTEVAGQCLVCGRSLEQGDGLCSEYCVRRAVHELDVLRARRKALARLLVSWRRRSWWSRTVSVRGRRNFTARAAEQGEVTLRTRRLTAALLAAPVRRRPELSGGKHGPARSTLVGGR